jgi:gliding motility-associated-like protein
VTDENGCVGRDTIQILLKQQCYSGFIIPNAFTPNGDGKNDLFRPLVFGSVKEFQFIIYNRWGQKVFETKKIGEGWNGDIKGKKDQASVFVWTCKYQIEGQEKKIEKGTVTLIR